MARDRHYQPSGKGPSCGVYWEEWDKYLEGGYEVEVLNPETGEACVFPSGKAITRTRHKVGKPLKTTDVEKVTCYRCLIHISTVVQKNMRAKVTP